MYSFGFLLLRGEGKNCHCCVSQALFESRKRTGPVAFLVEVDRERPLRFRLVHSCSVI